MNVGTVVLLRFSAIMLVTVAIGATATSFGAASEDPCAKQVEALRQARSRTARQSAKHALTQCRYSHAVSIAPAKPFANETVTVTIHPRWPLRRGYFYEVTITDIGGHIGDAFVHVASKRTKSLLVSISPADGAEPGAPAGAEWAKGKVQLEVREGTPRQLNELPELLNPRWHPKYREVGSLEFRFLPRPPAPGSTPPAPVAPSIDVENGGMFGVRVGQTDRQVRRALGAPDDVTNVRGLGIHWFYARFDLQIFLNVRTKRVVELYTQDESAKTAGGVGVESTKQQISQAFPQALCTNFNHEPRCNVGGRASVTTFTFVSAGVQSINIVPENPLPVALNPIIDVADGGMLGAHLGQSEPQVRSVLGRPDERTRDRRLREIDWYYSQRLDLAVYFDARTRRVTYLQTSDPRAKTANGLGVGSREAEIVGSFPGAVCTSPAKGQRSCAVGGRNSVTTFRLRSGSVYEIESSRG
jgi:hypothetical protein